MLYDSNIFTCFNSRDAFVLVWMRNMINVSVWNGGWIQQRLWWTLIFAKDIEEYLDLREWYLSFEWGACYENIFRLKCHKCTIC